MKPVRTLITLLIITLAGMGAWVYKTKEKQWEAEKAVEAAEDNRRSALLAKEEEMRRALVSKDQQHQREVEDLLQKHDTALTELRTAERQRMNAAFEEFSGMLEGSKRSLDYINLLEKKVKTGQTLSAAEAEKLGLIATGLTYLQKQYKKPFQEFTELEAHFARKAAENIETPNMRNAFWKRIFSRDFREQEREFYRTEGERRGFQEASARFAAAYGNAQRQMAAADVDLDEALAQLNTVITEKKNPENLDSFFDEARKALGTHQKLLDFEPDVPPAPVETIKP